MLMVGVDDSSLQAVSWLGLRVGDRLALSLHSLHELSELSQWPCVIIIIIIIIIFRHTSTKPQAYSNNGYYRYYTLKSNTAHSENLVEILSAFFQVRFTVLGAAVRINTRLTSRFPSVFDCVGSA